MRARWRRDQRLDHAANISAGKIMRLDRIRGDIRETGLHGHDLRLGDD